MKEHVLVVPAQVLPMKVESVSFAAGEEVELLFTDKIMRVLEVKGTP